ncbi:MAG TPA: PaaI family thioesterase [Planctomycetota bacterium]|nr:PaaI family thioesterase [Planctomycetota bacterium]
MRAFTPADETWEARVRASFARQQVMATLGITLRRLAPGEVDLEVPFQQALVQQHGFLHAGVLATMADSACGYAALTLMPADAGVLSIEFKINMMAPAKGERFTARAVVLRAGRNITVCEADVVAIGSGSEKVVARMLATMMTVRGRTGVEG